MKMYLDCYPCVLRNALEAVRFATDNEKLQYEALKKVVEELTTVSAESTPPEITARIHRIIKKVTGNPDPYKRIKRVQNEIALDLYSRIKERIDATDTPVLMTAKLAIAGNIIDCGALGGDFDLNTTVEETLRADLVGGSFSIFEKELLRTSNLLYLADNAGEIVFDKILIEKILQYSKLKVVIVVRGEPILNDATLEDAKFVGIDTIAEVITNEYDAPATQLNKASGRFKQAWKVADMVIAKGQGNFESLNEEKGNIFYLLKVKCPVLADDIGAQVGDSVLKRGK